MTIRFWFKEPEKNVLSLENYIPIRKTQMNKNYLDYHGRLVFVVNNRQACSLLYKKYFSIADRTEVLVKDNWRKVFAIGDCYDCLGE